jgi:hypothetical protein
MVEIAEICSCLSVPEVAGRFDSVVSVSLHQLWACTQICYMFTKALYLKRIQGRARFWALSRIKMDQAWSSCLLPLANGFTQFKTCFTRFRLGMGKSWKRTVSWVLGFVKSIKFWFWIKFRLERPAANGLAQFAAFLCVWHVFSAPASPFCWARGPFSATVCWVGTQFDRS